MGIAFQYSGGVEMRHDAVRWMVERAMMSCAYQSVAVAYYGDWQAALTFIEDQ